MEILLNYFSDFTPKQLEQFAALKELYTKWNEKINVISRKDIDALYVRHVLHSLAIAAVCNFHDDARVVDIGTGGGFPGIPLAIFFPEVEFVLADSIGKKIKVVKEISDAIGLKNVEPINSRVEDLKGHLFDFAISRAVAPLGDLWRWVRPMIRKGKCSDEFSNGMLCLKGGDLSQEIHDSRLNPHQVPVWQLFDEPAFEDKYVLYVPR